jgi:hypothetical protein
LATSYDGIASRVAGTVFAVSQSGDRAQAAACFLN